MSDFNSQFRKIAILFANCAFSCLLLSGQSHAANNAVDEATLKAAYIYSIAKFVEWPDAAFNNNQEHFNLCISHKKELVNAVTNLNGKEIHGKIINTTNVHDTESLNGCHILFIGNVSNDELEAITKKCANLHILTVSDKPVFHDNHVIVNLVTINNKIRFEIDLATAKASDLKISSRLLSLSIKVNREK